MTHLSMFGPGFKDFDRYFVGFEEQQAHMQKLHEDVMKNVPGYPPYNIKKTGENTYSIEIAVAGFGTQDINIEIDGGKLVVKGNLETSEPETQDFLFKGIATRPFTRSFALDDQIEVKDAELFNGMLKVFLERIIPEHKKPKKIDVKSKASKGTKDFLAE